MVVIAVAFSIITDMVYVIEHDCDAILKTTNIVMLWLWFETQSPKL